MDLVSATKKMVYINGLDKEAIITIEFESEDLNTTWMDDKDIKQYQKDLGKKIDCVWVRVRASFVGLEHFEGVDSIGQVFVRYSFAKEDVLESVYLHSMVQNATKDLVEQVLKGHETLDKFLNSRYDIKREA